MSSTAKGERGSVLVEFAITFFAVWLIFSGVYAFGYAFYVYNRLETAVANAALLGAVNGFAFSRNGVNIAEVTGGFTASSFG